jgi:protein-L-isoaspartate(D-aspartate) O-methyltransferase
MTTQAAQAEIARKNMVDSQIRPNQVNDARVIGAMRILPREVFAPASGNAYTDADIDLGGGRFMLAPMTIARLTQAVLASNPEHILVIAANTGYGAAILAGAHATVTALESDPRLPSKALGAIAPGITQVSGPLKAGWPATGPYDAILIEGAVTEIPASLIAQLIPGGRVVTILAGSAGPVSLGQIVMAQPSGDKFASVKMFDCTARLLPAFQPAPVFSF